MKKPLPPWQTIWTSSEVAEFLGSFLAGFGLGGGLIIAIGAQNAFVLRLGLLRFHVFAVCLFCAFSDALLIFAGILGLGSLVRQTPSLLMFASIGGAIFLCVYGLFALKRALRPNGLKAAETSQMSLATALSTCFALTFLNPHVYLDTVVLVGSISSQYSGIGLKGFGTGAISASFCWFFALGYGARILGPVFAKPRAWQVLDFIIALIMFALAFSLIQSLL